MKVKLLNVTQVTSRHPESGVLVTEEKIRSVCTFMSHGQSHKPVKWSPKDAPIWDLDPKEIEHAKAHGLTVVPA